MFEEPGPSTLLHRLAELGLLTPIHASLYHANFQLPYIEILSAEFGEFTIPDIMTFKRTLGWILWLMPLPEFDVDMISKRLDLPALLTKSARAASTLLNALPSFIAWRPSQWTFYLEDLPSISVYAVYLMRKEPALRDYLVSWRKIKPTITGEDLKKRGLEPGPKYAEILRQLRAAWLDGDVNSKEEELRMLEKLEN
jgi:tRNA nucleotidyltransferase (CCA-adding enzyme)